jgi:hypothetical protein
MDYDRLISAINILKYFCQENHLNFVVVGSVAYKGAYKYEFNNGCDDIDCIIIYDDIKKIGSFPYIDQGLYRASVRALYKNEVDLFATKFELCGVSISIDFISIQYFKDLSESKIDGESKFLKKMTDAEENPINDYYNFYGKQFVYEKYKLINRGFKVYYLPTSLFHNGEFFSGVLRNKFVHNPVFLVVKNKEILDFEKELLINYVEYYDSQKQVYLDVNIVKAIRRWDDFSNESKHFIKDVFKCI